MNSSSENKSNNSVFLGKKVESKNPNIKTYSFKILPYLKELTAEEKDLAIKQGVKLYKEDEVLKFKQQIQVEIKKKEHLTFMQKLIVCFNLLFNNTTTKELDTLVFRKVARELEKTDPVVRMLRHKNPGEELTQTFVSEDTPFWTERKGNEELQKQVNKERAKVLKEFEEEQENTALFRTIQKIKKNKNKGVKPKRPIKGNIEGLLKKKNNKKSSKKK